MSDFKFRFCLDNGARVMQDQLQGYAIEERDCLRRPTAEELAEIIEIEEEIAADENAYMDAQDRIDDEAKEMARKEAVR